MLDLVSSAQRLMDRVGQGSSISVTAYDTAWVAGVPSPGDRRDPRFPTAMQWVLDHQHADGSWGGEIHYPHDRVVSTLAALITLTEFGRRQVDRAAIARGERYLWQRHHLLRTEDSELVAFELLLSTLVQKALALSINVPDNFRQYDSARESKLALIPQHMLYSKELTLAHSLEFLGDHPDVRRLPRAQSANGSFGNSPSATAYSLHHVDSEPAAAYLASCLESSNGAAVPVLFPCETYEFLWSAYTLELGGVSLYHVSKRETWDKLFHAVQATGVSLSDSFPIPDADDTAVAFTLLTKLGYDIQSTETLKRFEREHHFVSFLYERHPSTGVNVHVMDALNHLPDYPSRSRALDKTLTFLQAAQIGGLYWLDKWHISPYYATSHAIASMVGLDEDHRPMAEWMLKSSVDWITHTQNSNGSWGFFDKPTVEETSYALLALMIARDQVPPVPDEIIHRGARYLYEHYFTIDFAPMWIDKCLYTPPLIVKSALISALNAYQNAFGGNLIDHVA